MPRSFSATLRGVEFRRVRLLWSAEVGSVVAQVTSGLVVARALGPSDYGAFALLLAYGGLIYTLFEPRAGELVIKYFGQATVEDRPQDAWVVLRFVALLDVVVVLLAVGLTAAALPWFGGFTMGSVQDAALAATSVALLGPVVTGRSVLSVLDRYGLMARVQLSATVLRSLATAVAAVVTGDVSVVLLALSLSTGAELVVTSCLAAKASRHQHGRRRPGPRRGTRALRGAAPGVGRFLLYSEANTVLGSLTKYSDTLLVGAFGGPVQAGFYRLARSLTQPVASLVTPLQTVAYNRFVRDHAASGPSALARTARRATLLSLPLAGGLAAACVAVPSAVRVLAGEEFAAAAPVAVVLMLATAVGLPYYWLRAAYVVRDRLRTWLVANVVISLAGTASFVVGAYFGDALGVAISRAIVVTLFGNLVLALLLKRDPGRAG